MRRRIRQYWLKRFGVARASFRKYKAKWNFALRSYSGKHLYSFAPFFRCLKSELMRFFLYGFFKPYFFKLSFFSMKDLYLRSLFYRRISAVLRQRRIRRKKFRRGKKRGLNLFKSKRLYFLRKRSLIFKGLFCKFSIGFFSLTNVSGVSNHSSSIYDFSLAFPFLQLLGNKRLRYRFFGHESFISSLLRYRIFNLKRRRFSLGLKGVSKTSGRFLEYRRFKRLSRRAPRLLRWHLYNVNF